jgi:septal ring factor EnvC (AmiA/AmiB activator)
MNERDHNGISARLWRLPGQLLLALTNATALLVIVAAVLALIAMARINQFAGNIGASMTEAVLSKVDLPSKDVLANIRELTGEVRALGNSLREIRTGENPVLQSEIVRLKDSLAALSTSVDRLRSSRSILTDEVAARFGGTLTQALMNLRDCRSSVGANGSFAEQAIYSFHLSP